VMLNERFRQTAIKGFGLCCLLLTLIPPVSGQDYTIEEYNMYQEAISQGEDAIIQFMKDHSESSLNQYAVGAYLDRMKGYAEKGQHAEVVAAGEKYLDAGVQGDAGDILYLTTWSAYYSQQYDKAARYGEKVYAQKPEAAQIVPILARAHLNTGNLEKAISYGESYCATVPPKDCYDLLPTITRHYFEKKDWKNASKNAKLTVEAFNTVEKPAQVSQEEWDNFANEERSVAHAVLGREAYETGKWASVERIFADSRKLNPKNKARAAESYYYTGMSLWKLEKIDPAMASFARGSQLKGVEMAEYCRKQLEHLYRATHNGSLAGLDEYLERNRP
jgi:tetratricopeptide (TPR) repeat protein